ncbi:hypothetical protein QA648_29025 (plasmid) [Rhizobium sp. CB3171]|uniref:hypothetical protein n=1 Tax=unclassified Rhizobium TaxID=2613769 RepID=UPI000CF2EC0E|nr:MULTISPECIES: hypothetical protein [Rhizobium]UWU23875.1 hypothetical protein N2601_26910 [Rhizobium tropici]WFU04803.1 hypothetical protein QA648_29025 [Rhizobium sp. CB3171]
MQYVEPKKVSHNTATRVWSVKDFCKRHRLCSKEETRLLQLFGQFATASELRYNTTRRPKWR